MTAHNNSIGMAVRDEISMLQYCSPSPIQKAPSKRDDPVANAQWNCAGSSNLRCAARIEANNATSWRYKKDFFFGTVTNHTTAHCQLNSDSCLLTDMELVNSSGTLYHGVAHCCPERDESSAECNLITNCINKRGYFRLKLNHWMQSCKRSIFVKCGFIREESQSSRCFFFASDSHCDWWWHLRLLLCCVILHKCNFTLWQLLEGILNVEEPGCRHKPLVWTQKPLKGHNLDGYNSCRTGARSRNRHDKINIFGWKHLHSTLSKTNHLCGPPPPPRNQWFGHHPVFSQTPPLQPTTIPSSAKPQFSQPPSFSANHPPQQPTTPSSTNPSTTCRMKHAVWLAWWRATVRSPPPGLLVLELTDRRNWN